MKFIRVPVLPYLKAWDPDTAYVPSVWSSCGSTTVSSGVGVITTSTREVEAPMEVRKRETFDAIQWDGTPAKAGQIKRMLPGKGLTVRYIGELGSQFKFVVHKEMDYIVNDREILAGDWLVISRENIEILSDADFNQRYERVGCLYNYVSPNDWVKPSDVGEWPAAPVPSGRVKRKVPELGGIQYDGFNADDLAVAFPELKLRWSEPIGTGEDRCLEYLDYRGVPQPLSISSWCVRTNAECSFDKVSVLSNADFHDHYEECI